jgi:predicted lipoprotein with Yx(FWY)xxD motif
MRLPPLIIATALAAIMLAACGSGGAYSSSASTKPTSATPPDGTAAVSTRDTSLGKVLADANGLTLYALTKDTDGTSTCVDACATAWPPLTVDSTTLPAGLDAKVFSVAARPDGSHQIKAGRWPLYRFAGDAAPGDTNGQGSGGVWFVVTPSGTLHKS